MSSLKRQHPFFTGILSALLLYCFSAVVLAQADDTSSTDDASAGTAVDTVSIVLVDTGEPVPNLNDVAQLLVPELQDVGVQVQLDAVEQVPENQDDWEQYTLRKSSEVPGLLGVFSWQCAGGKGCRILVMETQSLSLTSIPVGDHRAYVVKNGNGPGADKVRARNIAGGIEEVVKGELLFALPQVARQANDPSGKKYSRFRARSTAANQAKKPIVVVEKFEPPEFDRTAHRLWLEFGYLGNYPYPASRTQHGISFGMTVFIHRHFAPSLRIGGLGRRKETGQAGEMVAYQVPVGLHLQFPIYIGAAIFSIAPVAQYDYTWSRADTILGEVLDQYWSDFSFGGETTFRVPMPQKSLEIYFGAGILATLFSEDYEIYHEKVMPETKLQFYWYAGFSKNVFAR